MHVWYVSLCVWYDVVCDVCVCDVCVMCGVIKCVNKNSPVKQLK